MTEKEPDRRCAVCGELGKLEDHHLGLRSNFPSATVPLSPRSHIDQTARQWQAGVLPERREPVNPAQQLYALAHGVHSLISANQQAVGAPKEMIRTGERLLRAGARLLARVSDERPGALGPRPIANRRRAVRARARSVSVPKVRTTGRRAIDPTVAAEAFALGTFPALANAVGELLGGSRYSGYAEQVKRIGAGISNVVAAMTTFESHPRSAELAEVMQRDLDTLISTFELASAVPNVGEEELIECGRTIRAIEHRWLELSLALAAGPDSETIEAALSRFLEQATRR